MFLSPRTVEQHLVRVYQTLGIRSRAELVRLVATDPEFAREPGA
ncbi:MAG TPA: LuxR C-terminal-related transcriptional regulator [Acidimicrobiia bacterium]|nr:LuxR C-terminal-related transcriptional regulator [Acidimicrobiia bacterium]